MINAYLNVHNVMDIDESLEALSKFWENVPI